MVKIVAAYHMASCPPDIQIKIMSFYYSRHVLPDVYHGWRQICLLRDLNCLKRKRVACDNNLPVSVDQQKLRKALHDPIPDFIKKDSWCGAIPNYFRKFVQEKAYHNDLHTAQQKLEATREGVQCPTFHPRKYLQPVKAESAPSAELITAIRNYIRANLTGPYNQDIHESEPAYCLDFSWVDWIDIKMTCTALTRGRWRIWNRTEKRHCRCYRHRSRTRRCRTR